MSKVISFRLSKENPREAQAYEVLMTWHGRGYSIRQTVTEALLKLDECNRGSVRGEQLDEICEALRQLRQLIDQSQNGERIPHQVQDSPANISGLADNFIASIKKAAKPGITLD
jgi:hypothetical protein